MTYAPSAIGGDFTHILFADMALGLNIDPIPHLVGHNPQLLLTSDLFDVSRWNEADATPLDDIRRWMVAIIDADNVTRETLHAAAEIKGLREIIINIESASGDLPPIFPVVRSPLFRDYTPMIERHDLRMMVPRAKRQPTYLKHDPSKRHGRGRRKR